MQYKIPVQIENEDPIVLGLSLRQLTIIMVGWGLAYSIFNGLTQQVGKEIAAIPAIIIFGITLLIALFKQYEMTFIPFILALLRFNINYKERSWRQGTDSFAPIDIWYVTSNQQKKDSNVTFESNADKIEKLSQQLDKL
jgi:hypothetical protein